MNIQNTLGREFQVYRGEGRVSGLCGAALKFPSRACALSIRGWMHLYARYQINACYSLRLLLHAAGVGLDHHPSHVA